jgi:MSHA pilin protein MshB
MKLVKKQKGFTIIELVVVILLLGILTATALPRFMDVTDDAHTAVVSAVTGGFATGTSIFKAQWFANNQPNRVTEFSNLLANSSGYPLKIDAATVTSTLLATVGTSTSCIEVFQNILQSGGQPSITTKATAATGVSSLATLPSGSDFVAYLSSATATTKNICNYVYTGQYNNITLNALPVIQYNATTGAVTQTSI